MNKVILCGRLTADPEIRYSKDSQLRVGKYTLAVDRRNKEKDTDFINCICFDKAAEFAEKYFQKGQRVLVMGRWQTGSYTNKDGQKVYTNDCMVLEQEFADGKTDNPITQHKPDTEGFMKIDDSYEQEGLPFI